MKIRLISSLFSVALLAAVSPIAAQSGAEGQLDTSFNAGGGVGAADAVIAVGVQTDGKIIIGGFFTASTATRRLPTASCA